MAKLIFTGLVVLMCISELSSQCITANDIPVDESNLGQSTRELIDASTTFSLELFRNMNDQKLGQNDQTGSFFSPFSIWAALIMVYMGAQGPTELEMNSVLGLNHNDKPMTLKAFRNIHSIHVQKQTESGFNFANRVFFQNGTGFKECMLIILGNEAGFLDFFGNPDESREIINKWIEQETKGKIKDLIPSNGFTSQTNLVVANAVYFKKAWLQPFEPKYTMKRRFTTTTRKSIFVKMMNTRGRFLYGKSESLGCYALELPYSGNTLSMTILLPNNRYNGVDVLANSLTTERLKELLDDMYPREVVVSIPKFQLEDQFELSQVLKTMGLRTLFDRNSVDLSGFTGKKEYVVDAVRHKAFISVNEEGTEAAAATAVISSRSARPTMPASFIADYPFVFFIRDNLSGVILFFGTMMKPPEYETS